MFDQFRPFGSRGLFLQTLQIIVPVTDVGVVPFDVRGVDPFADLDLCLVWLWTFMDLQKILKAFFVFLAAQREDPADAGAERMDGTTSLCIQKGTGFPGACHAQIGKDDPICHLQFQMGRQKFFK